MYRRRIASTTTTYPIGASSWLRQLRQSYLVHCAAGVSRQSGDHERCQSTTEHRRRAEVCDSPVCSQEARSCTSPITRDDIVLAATSRLSHPRRTAVRDKFVVQVPWQTSTDRTFSAQGDRVLHHRLSQGRVVVSGALPPRGTQDDEQCSREGTQDVRSNA